MNPVTFLIGFLGSRVRVSANQHADGEEMLGSGWPSWFRDRPCCWGQVGVDLVIHSPPQAFRAAAGASKGKSQGLTDGTAEAGCGGKLSSLQVVQSPQDGAPVLSPSRERCLSLGLSLRLLTHSDILPRGSQKNSDLAACSKRSRPWLYATRGGVRGNVVLCGQNWFNTHRRWCDASGGVPSLH